MFPQLAKLVVEQVVDDGGRLVIRARTAAGPAPCPDCGEPAGRVHGYHLRRLADLPVAGRGLELVVRVRRLRCQTRGCRRWTFREQIPGLVARYARRTVGLAALVTDVGVAVAGRAGAALLRRLGVRVSRVTVLRAVMAAPVAGGRVPAVVSVDDFAVRRGHRYATLAIDPVTHRRLDVLPDRKADTLADWLREYPQVEVVCRDGSAAYAEAIRAGTPSAVQVTDRWHLWHGLAAAVEKAVTAYSGCWHTGPPRQTRTLDDRTRARHAAVHELLGQGLGLGAYARRLGWGMNTVKRYARATTVEQLLQPPKYRATLVDGYREHLRRRRAEQPDVPVTRLLDEIRGLVQDMSGSVAVKRNGGRSVR